MKNQVSATLSVTDQEVVMKALATIREKLPFLIHLSTADRRMIRKLGDKDQAFVRKAIGVAAQNPTMLPVAFDLDEMRKDAKLVEDLAPILLSVNQLTKQLEDTTTLAGREAFDSARIIYACAKGDFGGAALEDVASDLGQMWVKKARPTPPPPDPDPAATH